MVQYDISEFDVFFLSYDEPNAERHWANLVDICPWAERIHGVKGFDAVHRAAALKTNTHWFVTVDADNIVNPAFFNLKVEMDPKKDARKCLSWNGINMINGLMYGNGGLKLWSKDFVLNMNTHENATDPAKAVDFCWEADYHQVHRAYSEVWPNGSPLQAFRAGFREGVKLSLDRGVVVNPAEMKTKLHPINLRNLKIWCSVGRHVENGLWAMLGARLGWLWNCHTIDSFNRANISDLEWINGMFNLLDPEIVLPSVPGYAEQIYAETRIDIPELDEKASEFFRDCLRLRNE